MSENTCMTCGRPFEYACKKCGQRFHEMPGDNDEHGTAYMNFYLGTKPDGTKVTAGKPYEPCDGEVVPIADLE